MNVISLYENHFIAILAPTNRGCEISLETTIETPSFDKFSFLRVYKRKKHKKTLKYKSFTLFNQIIKSTNIFNLANSR